MVFQSQNRGYRDTRLYTIIIIICYLVPYFIYLIINPLLPLSPLNPHSYYDAATAVRALTRSCPYCYHQLFLTHVPDIRTIYLQRSRIVCVTMYCMTLFYHPSNYTFTSSNHTSFIANSELTSRILRGFLHVINLDTFCRNPPQGPDNVGGRHPHIQPKKNYRLHHRLE